MPRLTKIYTKTGDEGMTGLAGGQRVPKDSPTGGDVRHGRRAQLADRRGARDWARAIGSRPSCRRSRTSCSTSARTSPRPAESQARHPVPTVEPRHIEKLEGLIDEFNAVVGPLTNFLLPGGAPGAAQLHVARTICRRAEREATTLARDEPIGRRVLPYLNRLSDALFVMARYENHERGVAEPLWEPGS